MKEVYWIGEAPKKCETCTNPITSVFYDAQTRRGPWACMCSTCFTLGPGIGKLGTGYGQEFTRIDGRWKKTAG